MGDPRLAVRDRRSRSRAAKVPLTPLRLPSSAAAAACRRATAAASTVSARRACQRCGSSARPGRFPPAPLATPRATARRLHHLPGGSPVAAWPQESTWQPPRRLTWMSLHRIRCGPSCPGRGVCPRDIAISAIAALDCALRRPRRLQPTTEPELRRHFSGVWAPVERTLRSTKAGAGTPATPS